MHAACEIWLKLSGAVLYHQTIKRVSYLESCLLSLGLSDRVKVARTGGLLTVKKTSFEYTVITEDLPLLTYCELLC
jgi:hypothetical protein